MLFGASLVAQRLRIHLPMQGTRVRALVREDPTCRGATKPVRHNYWACALEPASHNYWACVLQLLKPAHLEPVFHNKRSHCNEKPTHRNEEQPCSPQLEKVRVQQWRPNTEKERKEGRKERKKKKCCLQRCTPPKPNGILDLKTLDTYAITMESTCFTVHIWVQITTNNFTDEFT